MIYLIGLIGIFAVGFGILMIFFPYAFEQIGERFNKMVVNTNKFLLAHRIVVGVFMLIAAAWGLLGLFQFSQFFLLYLIIAFTLYNLTVVFAILFLFFPGILQAISDVSDRVIWEADEYVIKYSKVIGFLILLGGIYVVIMMALLVLRSGVIQ